MGGRKKKRCFKGLLPVPGHHQHLLVPFLSTLAQLACKQNFWAFGHFFNVLILSLSAVSLQMLVQVCFCMFTLNPSGTQGNVRTILTKYGERS